MDSIRRQSVLVASSVALGSQEHDFQAGLGLDFGVDRHVFDSSSQSIAAEDEQRLVEEFTKRAETAPRFWTEYAEHAGAAGQRLISTARSVGRQVEQSDPDRALLEDFLVLTDAMRAMGPAVMATPAALGVLTSQVARRAADEAGPERIGTGLPGLLRTPWGPPDPVRAIRDGYRIAHEVGRDEAAAEVFRTTSPMIALDRIRVEFPELHDAVRNHVEEYGWLRTAGYRFPPLTAETVVYRIQLALLRWPADAIESAARPTPVPELGETLGFNPSELLAEQIAALQAMASQRAFRVDALLQAECVARPLFERVAGTLGCGTEHILFATADEIVAGLADRAELPIAEIDERSREGFTGERAGDAVVVRTAVLSSSRRGRSEADVGALTGMTACRGTAVGRVRIILDQDHLFALQYGDILVTAASTIDPTDIDGETTVFPTRNGGPHALALDRVAAVVADEGGLLSHAAIVCRERGLPCVLGTEVATTSLVDGQVIEVDATKPVGIVIPIGGRPA